MAAEKDRFYYSEKINREDPAKFLEFSLDHYILILLFKEENCLFYPHMCSEICLTIQNPTQLPPAITCCEFSAAIVCIGKVHQQEKKFRRKHFWKLRMSKAFQEMLLKNAFSKGHHIFINMRRLFSMRRIFLMVWESLENVGNEWKKNSCSRIAIFPSRKARLRLLFQIAAHQSQQSPKNF